ncbi:flagellar hook-basal body complex protein [Anaerospora sp.]|jgi:flagellar hook protein FlgE|uniref:flagellar hook protein FlgE n=1 Tax=Anaerospora sp. TaxID=1960278 RepID=UPI0028989F1B|nr:flagellar hook-basal body complex protein [Anaerospora sp.]
MMTAFFSGVSGLKAQQTSLDVIGNNISNVSTTGYKSQRVSFSDLLSQTISGASSSTATKGGTNAKQIGLGVSVGSIDTLMTVGSTQSTGVATDVSISGDGFFIVSGGSSGEYQFTRAGNFDVDEDGNLTVGGYKVCGWEEYTIDADGNYVFNSDKAVESINLYSDSYNGNKKILAAQGTTAATFAGNLDPSKSVVSGATLYNIGDTSNLTFDQTSTITVYDAQGNNYDIAVNWKKCAIDSSTNQTSWYWEASSTDGMSISPASGYIVLNADGTVAENNSTAIGTNTIPAASTIDTTATNTTGYANSNIAASTGLTAGTYTVTVAAAASGTADSYDIMLTAADGTTYTVTDSTDGAATFTTAAGTVTLSAPATLTEGSTTFNYTAESTNSYTKDTTPTLTLTPTNGSVAAFDVNMDFSDLLSYTSSTTSKVTGTPNGYESGELQSVSISSDGTIVGTYSNGQSQALAKIALATFTNPEGLEKVGSNLYAVSANSGNYTTVVAGSGGSGSLSAGTLEMSNVDLAEQFSNMMISQRAYQANSKVISTADEMLQSLINMVG